MTLVEPAATPETPRLLASRAHTVLLIVIMLAVAMLGAAGSGRVSTSPSRSHVAQYVALFATEWLLFWFTWRGLHRGGTPIGEVIGPRWRAAREVWKVVLAAAVFFLCKQVVLGALQALMTRAGYSRVAESHRTLQLMQPHGVLESAMWIVLSVTAGFVEEFVFRGYLQRQLAAWTRSAPAGIVLSAAVFGVAHGYQGPLSVLMIGAYGLLFGILAHVTRTLRPGMLAHAFEDTFTGLFGR